MQCCTFSIDDQLYGMDVLHVQEVLRCQPITIVPRSHPAIRGLMNLRGQIVPSISLRHRLGLPALPEGGHPLHVVVRTPDGPHALDVDVIGDVLDLDPSTLTAPPDTVPEDIRPFLSKVVRLQNRLLLLLDVHRILSLEKAA